MRGRHGGTCPAHASSSRKRYAMASSISSWSTLGTLEAKRLHEHHPSPTYAEATSGCGKTGMCWKGVPGRQVGGTVEDETQGTPNGMDLQGTSVTRHLCGETGSGGSKHYDARKWPVFLLPGAPTDIHVMTSAGAKWPHCARGQGGPSSNFGTTNWTCVQSVRQGLATAHCSTPLKPFPTSEAPSQPTCSCEHKPRAQSKPHTVGCMSSCASATAAQACTCVRPSQEHLERATCQPARRPCRHFGHDVLCKRRQRCHVP